MAVEPSLRVIVDGDATRWYRPGDEVKGRVILVLEETEQIKGMRLSFTGECSTKTSRPLYASGADPENCQSSTRDYSEAIKLFEHGKPLEGARTLEATKHTYNFTFTFPSQTDAQFSRWAHGSKYLREPHPLPPSFQHSTNHPGGEASIIYSVQALLVFAGSKGSKRFTQTVAYQPDPPFAQQEPKITSRVLYNQILKPVKDTRTAMDKVLTRVARKQSAAPNTPRLIPTLHFPESVSPGQHIPLLLTLRDADKPHTASSEGQSGCVLNSLTITLSTYTTSICGQPLTQPEDVVSKHVTCITRQDLNEPLPFGSATRLTRNFRLIDDAECVPTFKTYSITRRYSMTVTMGLKYQDQKFSVRAVTPLEILPKLSPSELRSRMEDDEFEVDPLPLYREREHSLDAPDYDSLYALTISVGSRGSSVASGLSTPSTAPSTPESELDRPVLDDAPPQYC